MENCPTLRAVHRELLLGRVHCWRLCAFAGARQRHFSVWGGNCARGSALRSQPVQFRDGLGDRLNRVTIAVYQRHTAHALFASAEILDVELRVESRSPLSESAHGLLASAENFCERRCVRINLCVGVCATFAAALACVTFHGVKAAQMVAQPQDAFLK